MRRDDRVEFDELFAALARRPHASRGEPNCDVALTDDGETLVVTVEIAGADPADLRVGVESRHLLIAGRRVDRDRGAPRSFLMKEIAYGDFAKRIHLPVAVAYERASASYVDGMLTIRLPVDELDARPTHRTEIHMIVRRIPA